MFCEEVSTDCFPRPENFSFHTLQSHASQCLIDLVLAVILIISNSVIICLHATSAALTCMKIQVTTFLCKRSIIFPQKILV